ncbi:MAG: DEAD/DEAH box helicase [Candidatus Geothermarchaeales archaeon]
MTRKKVKIEEIDLPRPVIDLLLESGYRETYPPQEMAIKAGVLENKNMILASPTASGKTLIAFMAASKHVYEGKGKVVYLVPLRALASEKYNEFKVLNTIRKKNGGKIRIRITTGDYDVPGEELGRADVIIATNEKMDSLMRHAPSWLPTISLIIFDEIHLVHYPDRGPTLEVLITRLLHDLPEAQILGLSATISNVEEFSKWIKADVITTDWRPVPLREGVFYDHKLFFGDGSSRLVSDLTKYPTGDITITTVEEGGQIIIFTRTRKQAVNEAKRMAKLLESTYPPSTAKGDVMNYPELSVAAREVLSRGEKTKLSETLADLVRRGSAFHHAGLSSSHRRIVENAFRDGLIKVLAATPTLAAGVNLPSRVVVITYTERYSMGYREPISIFEYKQMAGRAGRPTYDKFGEAILIARSEDSFDFLYDMYVNGEPERLTSKLGDEDVLDMHILGLIASKRRQRKSDVIDFFESTLYGLQESPKKIFRKIHRSLGKLKAGELISDSNGTYQPTPFGRRVAQLYISPSTGMYIREQLEPLRDEPVHPLGYLHLICSTPDMPLFPLYRRESKKLEALLDENEEHLLIKPPSQLLFYTYSLLDYLQQFKSALVLYDWMEEISEDGILSKWRVEPGDLHSAAYTAEWLLYSASQLALLFKRRLVADELLLLSRRVRYGIKRELTPLVELEGVGRVRARSLYNSGYKSMGALAKASVSELERVPGIGGTLAKAIKDQISKGRV